MTVRLCMLARDEAHRIADVADAVGQLVDDAVVLIDDRTLDDTAGAVELELPRARVQPFRFVDFAQARNELFAAARQGLGAGDYLLLVDPDSPPRGRLPGDLTSSPSWSCTWHSGSFDYHLPILVEATVDCRYEGACHELLVGVSPRWTPELDVVVEPKPDGVDRSELYAELLRPGAEAGDPRAAFYLARTLRDQGRVGEAIEWYLRRAQLGHGWIEETFICLLDAGVLLLALDVELAQTLLERARAFRPGRLEPAYHLAWLANWRGDHELAAELAAAALRQGPSSDALFVNRWAETHGLVDELNRAIAGGADQAAAIATLIPEGASHG
jgi:tetratricopeptide (TPR) repeat protein